LRLGSDQKRPAFFDGSDSRGHKARLFLEGRGYLYIDKIKKKSHDDDDDGIDRKGKETAKESRLVRPGFMAAKKVEFPFGHDCRIILRNN
jgi:hypothetical protein